MKTTSQKNSMGNGFGINRGTSGASSLTTATPAMKNVTVRPGLGKPIAGGAKHGRHFQGAKIR